MYNRFLIMMNGGVFDAVYSESQPSRKAKTFSRLTTRTGVNMVLEVKFLQNRLR